MESPRWDTNNLRTKFTQALSNMYREEVPLYGQLVQIVHDVDRHVLTTQGEKALPLRNQLERHGAIRLGTEAEMQMIRRLFALLDMHPVGYYDLQTVGFPLHGTAFRPIDADALDKNPFRVFTTVLRSDLLSPGIRETAQRILQQRNLFTPRLREIIDRAENQNQKHKATATAKEEEEEEEAALTAQDEEDLITEALKIFKWHSRSTVSIDDYLTLKQAHPIVADIVCFPSAHINHLTPRTLDIDLVQREMIRRGLPAKDVIEGPPRRQCPILLRQTSFKALEESVHFAPAPGGGSDSGDAVTGTHTARFGEVEQRGAALTRKGRALYDELLAEAVNNTAGHALTDNMLLDAFRRFPDTWDELRLQGLVYFRYGVTQSAREAVVAGLDSGRVSVARLLELGLIEYEPITYEDFLPFSAAGIFRSNLPGIGQQSQVRKAEGTNVVELERVLGCEVLDEIELYGRLQEASIEDWRCFLGLEEIIQ